MTHLSVMVQRVSDPSGTSSNVHILRGGLCMCTYGSQKTGGACLPCSRCVILLLGPYSSIALGPPPLVVANSGEFV